MYYYRTLDYVNERIFVTTIFRRLFVDAVVPTNGFINVPRNRSRDCWERTCQAREYATLVYLAEVSTFDALANGPANSVQYARWSVPFLLVPLNRKYRAPRRPSNVLTHGLFLALTFIQ